MTFIEFAESYGLIIRNLVESNRWTRVPTLDKPKHRNGSYKFLGDVGFIQNHATMGEVAVWRENGEKKEYTDEEKRAYAKKMADIRTKEIKDRTEAIRKMREYWNSLKPLQGGHEYLTNKELSMRGCQDLRVDGDLLVIPVYRNKELVSVQTIEKDGSKKYRFLCPIKGGSYVLNRPNATLTCIVEGFATGLAIFQTLPESRVVICFDAGNMVEVTKTLNVKGLTVVCADNDWLTMANRGTNPGLKFGEQAAQSIGCGIAYPKGIIGSDWADCLKEWNRVDPRKRKGEAKLRVEIMRGARPIF